MALKDSQNQKWVDMQPLAEYAMLAERTGALLKNPYTSALKSDTIANSYLERSEHVDKCGLEGAIFGRHKLDPLYLIDKAIVYAESNTLKSELEQVRARLVKITEARNNLATFRANPKAKLPARRA